MAVGSLERQETGPKQDMLGQNNREGEFPKRPNINQKWQARTVAAAGGGGKYIVSDHHFSAAPPLSLGHVKISPSSLPVVSSSCHSNPVSCGWLRMHGQL